MRTSLALVSLCTGLTLAATTTWWLTSSEVIQVRALEDVPLFDPASLAGEIGGALKQVGQLDAGDELQVGGCADTKSDINVYAAYRGQVVAVGEWKAKVQLLRGHAYPWEQGATSSCQGFFRTLSTHA